MPNLLKIGGATIFILLLAKLVIGGEALNTKVKQLTNNTGGISSGEASWSPDGKIIAYTRLAEPLGSEDDKIYLSSIWIMNADGSNQQQVSPVEKWDGDGKTSVAGGVEYSCPQWSPDGSCLLVGISQIAFMEKGRANGDDYNYEWDCGDAIIDINTRKMETVVEITPPRHRENKNAVWKADKGHEIEIVDDLGYKKWKELFNLNNKEWSDWVSRSIKEKVNKDNKGVFFIKEKEEKNKGKAVKDLWMRNRKGKDVLLAENFTGDLIWSANKKKVAFITTGDEERNKVLYIMNADGTGLSVVPDMPRKWDEPDWSPDGTKMIFGGKDNSDEWNIWQITIEDNGDKK